MFRNVGSLPLICDAVTNVSVGSPCVRSKLQKPLDSYQEEDLNQLRRKWSDALGRRREVERPTRDKCISNFDGKCVRSFAVPGLTDPKVREQIGQV